MESFEISLGPEQGGLNRPDTDLGIFLADLFAPASANYRQLALELQREFREGGSPDVTRMCFDRVKYNELTCRGSFRIVLDVRFTFGCEDSVTEKTGQTSEWTFEFDTARKTVTFQNSPFAESRSTADEF